MPAKKLRDYLGIFPNMGGGLLKTCFILKIFLMIVILMKNIQMSWLLSHKFPTLRTEGPKEKFSCDAFPLKLASEAPRTNFVLTALLLFSSQHTLALCSVNQESSSSLSSLLSLSSLSLISLSSLSLLSSSSNSNDCMKSCANTWSDRRQDRPHLQ